MKPRLPSIAPDPTELTARSDALRPHATRRNFGGRGVEPKEAECRPHTPANLGGPCGIHERVLERSRTAPYRG